jgi:hypothetical protein
MRRDPTMDRGKLGVKAGLETLDRALIPFLTPA